LYIVIFCNFAFYFGVAKMVKMKKILSLFLFVLFVGYYASTNFFYHSHEYAWGTITHSHPYTSGTHTHSVNVLQLINILTNTPFVGGWAILFLALFSIAGAFVCSFYRQHTLNSIIGGNLLRAPPAVA